MYNIINIIILINIYINICSNVTYFNIIITYVMYLYYMYSYIINNIIVVYSYYYYCTCVCIMY